MRDPGADVPVDRSQKQGAGEIRVGVAQALHANRWNSARPALAFAMSPPPASEHLEDFPPPPPQRPGWMGGTLLPASWHHVDLAPTDAGLDHPLKSARSAGFRL